MLSSNIGRFQFFFYSVAISIAESIAVTLCVLATIGFTGLVNSKPGPSRESLTLVSLVVMMVFALARANITWRRGNDADLSKWLLVPYIVFLALFAVLQAATLLIYDFKTGSANTGLGIFSLASFGLWFRICLASSKSGSFDPDAFLRAEGYGEVPGNRSRPAATASASARPSMASAPAIAIPRGPSNGGAIVFGKRGRA